MDADLRRRRAATPPSVDSDPALEALIAEEIQRTGPLTFARFMDLALYALDHGYYMTAATRIGRGGDFLTAPETHPIFGAAVARQIEDAWRRLGSPADFVIREYGAGEGALARSILGALAADSPDLAATLRYEAGEINPHRRAALADNPPNGRFGALAPDRAAQAPQAEAAFVIANEFFDAFPVHLVRQGETSLEEVFVDRSGDRFVERVGPPSTPRLTERLAAEEIELRPGQRAEIALGLDDWFGGLAAWLRSGVLLVVDYGHPARELYGPKRFNGTLMGYLAHTATDDPLVAVGRQDLTARVDFTALERAARAAGLPSFGTTTQAQFLLNLGLEQLLERARSDPSQTLGEYLELRAGIGRLLDPRQTGGFRVLLAGRGLDPEPPLLGMRRPRP